MTDPAFNLAQLERRPNWYQHLGAVENAMAAEDELYRIRWQAGWTCDEGGWTAPDGTHESDWELEGYPFPEDPGYQQWADAFWHYERQDNADASAPSNTASPSISITLDQETWTGVLFHLQDTVETIPVSTIEPDPWQCVKTAIDAIKLHLPSTIHE